LVLLESLLWKVLLEDGAVVTRFRGTPPRTPLGWTLTRSAPGATMHAPVEITRSPTPRVRPLTEDLTMRHLSRWKTITATAATGALAAGAFGLTAALAGPSEAPAAIELTVEDDAADALPSVASPDATDSQASVASEVSTASGPSASSPASSPSPASIDSPDAAERATAPRQVSAPSPDSPASVASPASADSPEAPATRQVESPDSPDSVDSGSSIDS
jgi:hypothetical protein